MCNLLVYNKYLLNYNKLCKICAKFTNSCKSYFNINYRHLLKNKTELPHNMKNIYQFAEVHFTI